MSVPAISSVPLSAAFIVQPVLTILLGFEVISKVPSVLHTPLMSGANAISGIVILGAIILIRTTDPSNVYTLILASLALLVGSINVFGGFFVTNRMLEMFNKKKKN